jgi:hypothetical protein
VCVWGMCVCEGGRGKGSVPVVGDAQARNNPTTQAKRNSNKEYVSFVETEEQEYAPVSASASDATLTTTVLADVSASAPFAPHRSRTASACAAISPSKRATPGSRDTASAAPADTRKLGTVAEAGAP